MTNKEEKLTTIELLSVSIVSHCPYCGSSDWETSFKKPNGEMCEHPTKLLPKKEAEVKG